MDAESVLTTKRTLPADQDAQDAQDLALMGHEQSLTRKFNFYSMFSLAFCVLGKLTTSDPGGSVSYEC